MLPPEDHTPGMCGKLNKSLYGTRDAAQNWGESYMKFMESVGFHRGIASPCCFYNQERNLRCVVHGDDFTVLGYKQDLDWFRIEIQRKYEVKIRGRIGPGAKYGKEIES